MPILIHTALSLLLVAALPSDGGQPTGSGTSSADPNGESNAPAATAATAEATRRAAIDKHPDVGKAAKRIEELNKSLADDEAGVQEPSLADDDRHRISRLLCRAPR